MTPTGRVLALTIKSGDVAAIVAAAVSGVTIIVLLVVLGSLIRTLKTLRLMLEELRQQTLPLLGEVRVTVGQATAELERVDTLLGTAESISATVDSASRLAYLTFSNPLIKALAFFSGSARAFRRLRRRAD
jgi:hypothetical protein